MLLIAFCGKFYSFYKLFMPKLLSQSKHEKFESNSALQIRDQKEKKVENAKKLELQEIWKAAKFSQLVKFSQVALFILRNLLPARTVHPTALFTLVYYSLFLLFEALTILFPFGFLHFLPPL